MASGFGRGGRGAALQQALLAPARKPGEAPPATIPTNTSGQNGAPKGRASALKSLLEKQASDQMQSPSVPVGRSSLLKMAMQAQKTAAVGSDGRGQALLQGSPRVPSPHVTSTSPTAPSPQEEEESVLAQRLSRLTIDRPVVANHGKEGKQVKLAANSIRIKCNFRGMYQYVVSFTPQVDSRKMRSSMIAQHQSVLGSVRNFDGCTLCLLHKLPSDEVTFKCQRESDGEEVTVRVRLVKALPMSACIQPINVLLRKIMELLKMVQVNRHYYNPHRKEPVPQHRLEVWPGYVTAIEEQEDGLLLLCDVSHRVLRTETVLDCMHDLVKSGRRVNVQEEIKKMITGVTVLTRYNNKTYRIDDVDFSMTPEHTFTSSDGTPVRFVDYYKKMYDKEIVDLQQPMLIHRVKAKDRLPGRGKEKGSAELICLVPELCYMTGLNDDMRADFRLMKELAIHTRVTPAQRQRAMRKFVEDVASHPGAVSLLEKWGIQLDTDLVSVDGRTLTPTDIYFHGDRKESAGVEADWGRAVSRNKVITPVGLANWLLLFTQRDSSKARDFLQQLMQEGPKMGIDVKQPCNNGIALPNDRTESYLTAIRQNVNEATQIVVCIFPTSRDDRYNAFKKLCCVECPVPSQAINARTVGDQRKLRSVTQKIALQMNCKMGGVLWGVKIPTKKLMVVGIDVYHDGNARQRSSIAGIVASTNSSCTCWYSRTCRQMPGQELVDSIRPCFTAALKKYYEVNHDLPDKIFVYRDGVGDGQLNFVAKHEAPQLEHCFKDFGEAYNPKLVYVVVQKRINQRIFLKKGGAGGQMSLENPPPGTILDHTITRRHWYDFFLVSQHVRQGTVSPTHYVVVHDGGDWNTDKIQMLTYRLTHMYYNWPGTIRVPAPCQYAHKLAYQVGQSIRGEFSLDLADRLFFL